MIRVVDAVLFSHGLCIRKLWWQVQFGKVSWPEEEREILFRWVQVLRSESETREIGKEIALWEVIGIYSRNISPYL